MISSTEQDKTCVAIVACMSKIWISEKTVFNKQNGG